MIPVVLTVITESQSIKVLLSCNKSDSYSGLMAHTPFSVSFSSSTPLSQGIETSQHFSTPSAIFMPCFPRSGCWRTLSDVSRTESCADVECATARASVNHRQNDKRRRMRRGLIKFAWLNISSFGAT